MSEVVRLAGIPAKLRDALAMQTWEPDRRLKWVHARLAVQLRAAAGTRYGRELGLDPAAGIDAVPPLERATLRDRFADLLGVADGPVHPRRTSGSTGSPVRVVHGPETIGWAAAGRLRQLTWFGLEPTDHPQLNVRIASRADDPLLTREERDPPLFWLNPYALDAAGAADLHDRLVAAGGVRLVGAESSLLEQWAALAAGSGRDPRDLGVRLAICGGEITYPHQRRAAEEAFGCAVAELYGSHELALIATECPAGSLHVIEEAVHVEVLAAEGEPGEVLVSLLHNTPLPLLRYRLGDVAALEPGPCACGSTLRRLRLEVARLEDMVRAPSGRLLHPRFLRSIYERCLGDALRGFHTTQTPEGFTVALDVDGPLPADIDARLAGEIGAYLGEPVAVRAVAAIPARPPAGKLRTFTFAG